jgi:preprotein translocase SecE subunit
MLHQRYVLLSFVIGAILVGLTVQSASSSLFVTLQVPDLRLGFMSTTSVLSVVSGVLAFVVLIRNRQAISFVDEVVDELYKVTWPTREETVKASTTVVFTTLFTAALLGFYDLLWKNSADIFLFGKTPDFSGPEKYIALALVLVPLAFFRSAVRRGLRDMMFTSDSGNS